MWGLQWTEWYWDRFFTGTLLLCYIPSVLFLYLFAGRNMLGPLIISGSRDFVLCVCVCVCVCARARARACVCVRARACAHIWACMCVCEVREQSVRSKIEKIVL